MVVICDKTYENTEYNEYFNYFNFELSDFQKYSIEAIVTGNHSLVTAHTGSGKTLPAEFAIRYFKSKGKKIVYTSPIKALSNQKYYEFTNKYPDISFGIFTGDIKMNPCADVLIMTTEILMNYLYNLNSEIIEKKEDDFELNINEELACVIFDEVHYINDENRGKNWEQTILMLPEHIQMIMLSATIDSPDKFAKWCERESNKKQVYLSSTYKRVVPLTHYGFLITNEGVFKTIKNKELQEKIKGKTNKFITLKSKEDNFDTNGYLSLKSTIDLFEKNNIFVNRTHCLNKLAYELKEQEMLPAIAFVFSRKNVEVYAKSITTNILEFDSKIPYTIKNECDSIIRKLPNYKEYMNLPEYEELVKLLEKGIGIHHSGMIPILREIVEYMISKKNIKMLFATESFAIGLDCPIRTAIFTSLTKFDGEKMRYLLPHEYSQAAGRAGRRGLDTVGHIIHCNNMFTLPSENEYRDILCGKPQVLVSKFQISFQVILNLIKNGSSKKEDFIEFVNKSMLKSEILTDVERQEKSNEKIKEELDKKREYVKNLRTPLEVCNRYIELTKESTDGIYKKISNKLKKEKEREIESLKSENKFLLDNVKEIKLLRENEYKYNSSLEYLEHSREYISIQVENVCKLLKEKNFIIDRENNYELTELGENASNISEIHSLVITEILEKFNYFEEYDTQEIIGILSIFSDIKIKEELKSSIPNTKNTKIKEIVNEIKDLYLKYEILDSELCIYNGTDYENSITNDVIDVLQEWCKLEDEAQCKYFIGTSLEDKEISIGDFTKGILKISTISKELSKICNKMEKTLCLSKLEEVDTNILKYVATTQSLYI